MVSVARFVVRVDIALSRLSNSPHLRQSAQHLDDILRFKSDRHSSVERVFIDSIFVDKRGSVISS
jgi:hypothetical protein